MKENWNDAIEKLEAIHRSEVRTKKSTAELREIFLAKWEKQKNKSQETARAFADGFREAVEAKGYNGQWAMTQCTKGIEVFRRRADGAGRKADKVKRVMNLVNKLDMSAAEIAKLVKQLAK